MSSRLRHVSGTQQRRHKSDGNIGVSCSDTAVSAQSGGTEAVCMRPANLPKMHLHEGLEALKKMRAVGVGYIWASEVSV